MFTSRSFSIDASGITLHQRDRNHIINKDQLTHLELSIGTDVKRPIVSYLFGIGMIAFAVWVMSGADVDVELYYIIWLGLRIFGSLVVIGGIGAMAIYAALPIHQVLIIRDQENEFMFALSGPLKKRKDELNQFLREQYGSVFKNHLPSSHP